MWVGECNAPEEIYKFPTLANVSCKFSEGFPTPVTSPLRPPKPQRTERRPYSWRNSKRKEVCMYICILESSKTNEEEEELKSRHIKATNYDVIDDAIIATPDDDITHRELEVNRLIARRRQILGKNLLMYSVGGFGRSLMACSRTITFVALLLAIIINVTKGLVNIRPSEGKSIVGNSPSLPLSAPISSDAFPSLLFLYILRVLAAFIGINEGFCHYMTIKALGDNSKRLKRHRKVLHNTRMRDKHTVYLHRPLGCHGYAMSIMQYLARPVLAGKCLGAYFCLFAHFWASRMFYSSIYTVNLELDDNFKGLFDLIYLYIYNVYRSWVSCKGATYFADIFTKTYTLVYFLPNVITLVIKSHDKYQSILLIGLGHVERANWEKQSIFGHNRSYWRELRPLVTPWTFCIKEGIEPWKSQKWSVTSHVQVRVPLLSLSLSLSPLLLSCHALLFLLLFIIDSIIMYIYL